MKKITYYEYTFKLRYEYTIIEERSLMFTSLEKYKSIEIKIVRL